MHHNVGKHKKMCFPNAPGVCGGGGRCPSLNDSSTEPIRKCHVKKALTLKSQPQPPSPSILKTRPQTLQTTRTRLALTLGAHQHQRDLTGVSVVGHPAVVMVDSLETDLILQAEDKDDGVHPHGKLQREEWRRAAKAVGGGTGGGDRA